MDSKVNILILKKKTKIIIIGIVNSLHCKIKTKMLSVKVIKLEISKCKQNGNKNQNLAAYLYWSFIQHTHNTFSMDHSQGKQSSWSHKCTSYGKVYNLNKSRIKVSHWDNKKRSIGKVSRDVHRAKEFLRFNANQLTKPQRVYLYNE